MSLPPPRRGGSPTSHNYGGGDGFGNTIQMIQFGKGWYPIYGGADVGIGRNKSGGFFNDVVNVDVDGSGKPPLLDFAYYKPDLFNLRPQRRGYRGIGCDAIMNIPPFEPPALEGARAFEVETTII